MKVFFGSSTESLPQLRLIGSWVEERSHKVIMWDNPELFLPGSDTFTTLIEIANSVDAAIFIFGEDDKVWYRQDSVQAPRDNVLLEYGLFSGILGRTRVAICRHGQPKTPTDLQGLTCVDINESKLQAARIKISTWLNKVLQKDDEPLALELAILRKENQERSEELAWIRQANEELIERISSLDTNYGSEGFELLYDYSFTNKIAKLLMSCFDDPGSLKNYMDTITTDGWVDLSQSRSRDSHIWLTRKLLRVIRRYWKPQDFATFKNGLPREIQGDVADLYRSRRN